MGGRTQYSGRLVIYGELGVRQYYGYTKAQAKQMYKDEYEKKIVQARRK